MGVIYKLKPEIKNFILNEKKAKPQLSCRKLAALANTKFQIKISKSHVNSLIKETGLSSPVGRTPKPKRGVIEGEGLGTFILKAADALLGGSEYVTKILEKKVKAKTNLLSLNEALVYQPLFADELKLNSGLWKIINRQFNNIDILSYLSDLQRVIELKTDIIALLNLILQEVLFLRLHFAGGSMFNLDAQLYSLWSTPNIPYDFSITQYKIKSYINKYYQEAQPWVIFTAPGYEVLTKEWLEFLFKITAEEKKIEKISLLNNKLKEVETITLPEPKSFEIIFGLWPWQHAGLRKVEFLGDFLPFYSTTQNLHFYLAETIIQLPQPNTMKSVTLKGAVLKRAMNSRAEIVILSNIPKEKAKGTEIAERYLNCWPNFQESLKKFSRKIELFTYSEAARQSFPLENLLPAASTISEIKEIFTIYLKILDAYVRWRFLPLEYRKMEFSTTKERFYQLKAKIKKQKNGYFLNFLLPADYPFGEDLKYAVSNLNEQEIILPEGKRLWFIPP